ncbi:gamma-glutamyltransferase family protein [Parvularcula oceani]|uniref:gamma-glutamyltransferase family protein n=1 Tax=Parvularcula oceani TaxID=1247963 RepID=UPI00055C94C7|nr:gamma-glutamyltransferase family protein [Parvularcula oceani]
MALIPCVLTACARGDGETRAPAEAEAVDAVASPGAALPEAGASEGQVEWAVAAANPLAVDAGAEILREGGSAVDAAIAVQAVLGLVEPQSSGLGGGAFMLYYDAGSDSLTAYDGRETAPASAGPDMFLEEDGRPMGFYDAVTSGYSVGVPGVVAMLGLAHEQHGELSWDALFDAAIAHADNGFTVSPRLAGLIEKLPRLKQTPAAAALYFDEEGMPLEAGDRLVNADYARTLRTLASEGPASFYTGSVAGQIVEAVTEKTGPGVLTMDDMAAYEPVMREPVCSMMLSYELCSMGPPSSGGVTLLQILSLVDETVEPGDAPEVVWPAYVEASRLAYADRDRYLADPAYMAVGGADADAIVSGLLSDAYMGERAELIGAEPAEAVEPGEPVAQPIREGRADDNAYELPSTSHFSIRDAEGNVVSMTTSVEFAFGSHLVAGGMVLNNQLTDFSREPSADGIPVANAPAPGKRPRSSMTPVIALQDEAPVLAIGSPGGPAIIGYVAKTLVARYFLGDDIQTAVERPHLVTARGGVATESEDLARFLRAVGYEPEVRELTSGLYGFEIVGEEVIPAVDPRREGTFESADD